MNSPDQFKLLDREVIENPYPFYSALLREAPVYRVPGTDVYLISGYQLIHEVLKNQRDYSANLTGILVTGENGQPELFDLTQFGGSVDAIANADEPSHSIHRKLVMPQFTARKMAEMEADIRQWAQTRIATLIESGGGDCVETVANPIPVLVIAKLMGLPVNDLGLLLGWAFSGGDILAGTSTLTQMVALGDSTAAMVDYLQAHFAAIQNTAQAPTSNVMQELANGVELGLISESDAIAISVVLVGAAGESTASLIGSAIRVLAQDGELQDALRQQPELIENYIEEIVRLESPFKGHYRVVLNDTTLGGVNMPSGARAYLLWAAANRDPTVFHAPEQIDLYRRRPQEHLGFGYGIHFCIGARLARLETRIILEELLARTANFKVDPHSAVKHHASIFVRRLRELHLTFEPGISRSTAPPKNQ